MVESYYIQRTHRDIPLKWTRDNVSGVNSSLCCYVRDVGDTGLQRACSTQQNPNDPGGLLRYHVDPSHRCVLHNVYLLIWQISIVYRPVLPAVAACSF